MTTAELAAQDQAEARERNLEKRVARIAVNVLALGLALGGYSMLAIEGYAPAPPWAPAATWNQPQQPKPPAPVLEIPEGYEPAQPVAPEPRPLNV